MDIFEADRLFMKQALEEAQHAALLGKYQLVQYLFIKEKSLHVHIIYEKQRKMQQHMRSC